MVERAKRETVDITELRERRYWGRAQNNRWYQLAQFTAKYFNMSNCLVCSPSPMTKIVGVATLHNYKECAEFNKNYC